MKIENLINDLANSLGIPIMISRGNVHVVLAGLVAVFLLMASFVTWFKLKKIGDDVAPSDRLSITSIFEIVVETVLGFMEGMMGAEAKKYLPLIGTLFVYIFICNILGAIPGFVPPTGNMNTNLACAVCVFFYYNYVGIRKLGLLKYLKHMAGPVIWLAPLMLTIEVISHLVRPISLSVRLFGNMRGDHMVLEIFSDLTPVLVPIIFMGLTIFVAFIQAFVFSLLSTIYISLATTEHSVE